MKNTLKIIGMIAIVTGTVFLSSCASKKKMQYYFFSYAKKHKKVLPNKNPERIDQTGLKTDSALSSSALYASVEEELYPSGPKLTPELREAEPKVYHESEKTDPVIQPDSGMAKSEALDALHSHKPEKEDVNKTAKKLRFAALISSAVGIILRISPGLWGSGLALLAITGLILGGLFGILSLFMRKRRKSKKKLPRAERIIDDLAPTGFGLIILGLILALSDLTFLFVVTGILFTTLGVGLSTWGFVRVLLNPEKFRSKALTYITGSLWLWGYILLIIIFSSFF